MFQTLERFGKEVQRGIYHAHLYNAIVFIQIHTLCVGWCCQDRREGRRCRERPLLSRCWRSAYAGDASRDPCHPSRNEPSRCNTCQSSVCGLPCPNRSINWYSTPCILPASCSALFRASSRSCSSFLQCSLKRLYSFCKALKSSRC